MNYAKYFKMLKYIFLFTNQILFQLNLNVRN